MDKPKNFKSELAALIRRYPNNGDNDFTTMIGALADAIATGILVRCKHYPEAAAEMTSITVAQLSLLVTTGLATNFANELGATTH
jgi:hypothetical protein